MHAIRERDANVASEREPSRQRERSIQGLGALVLVALASCGGGSDDPDATTPPADPPPQDATLGPGEDPPGLVLEVLELEGASGADGSFRVGDRVRVRFTLTKDGGGAWGLSEMASAKALISGPSFNYQRVIAEQGDLAARAVKNGDGSYTYAFADPLPATYLAPYNDTPSFGALEGELTDQALLAGTYAVGLTFAWSYATEHGVARQDVGEATADFLFGGASTLAPRRVTAQANCNQCHTELEAHGGRHTSVTLCVLCHTSGAEDLNDPSIAGGTPGRSIDLRVLVHKIHNARHLPSVNGVELDSTGHVDYGGVRVPYELVDGQGVVHDYSDVGFPVWPNRTIPMPKDFGHKNLSALEQRVEDTVRTGVTACFVCHGDPDGTGPISAPAQGDLVYAQPTRHACGACHDDVDFDSDYVVNLQTMPAQPDNTQCVFCHDSGNLGFYGPLSARDAHLHPLRDPAYVGATFLDFTTFTGLELALQSIDEAGASNGNGAIDVGERIELRFALTDAQGGAFPLAKLAGLSAVLSGPSWNSNLLHEVAIPKAMLSGSSPFAVRVPERRLLERVGGSTAALGESFATDLAPHWNVSGATTVVRVVASTAGGSSQASTAVEATQNFVDVDDPSGFARNDFVVVDAGGSSEEYFQLQLVDGDRLWFSSPSSPAFKAATAFAHAAGASVDEVTLQTKVAGVDYALDAAAGTITEIVELGAGRAVLVDYTSDFVVPASYPASQNDSPDLGLSSGEWRGKALVAGTYRIALEAHCELNLNAQGEDNFYRYAAPASTGDFQLGTAAASEPYDLIESGASCNACHQELVYHGATWRGFDACIACHGNAGGEDRPTYVSANAPQTLATTVNFRSLLHKIHRGSELSKARSFQTIGSGTQAYPDDFSIQTYQDILFPARPDRTAQCAKCHGASTSWIEPAPRDHPLGQAAPTRVWGASCGSCHDSDAATAHIESRTGSLGFESCEVCHGPDAPFDVESAHHGR